MLPLPVSIDYWRASRRLFGKLKLQKHIFYI